MQLQQIRIVLADDHPLFLRLLQAALDNQSDMHVLCTATDGEEAHAAIVEQKPDVAVLGVDMPGRGVLDILGGLNHRQLETRIVLLTGSASDGLIEHAIRLKVWGYLHKSDTVEFVAECLRKVNSGQRCFSEVIRQRIAPAESADGPVMRYDNALSSLTHRQIEILRHIASGDTTKEAATKLHLSPKSIDSHKYRIMRKLNVHNNVHLTRFAIREGLIRP